MKTPRHVVHRKPLRRLGPNVWVVRRGPAFSIKEEGTRHHLVPPIAQRLAIRIARLIAQANHSELIVQSRAGKIRARDSHGPDAFPPRG
jgi:hypothetical protein